jgi:chromosome partitioning protein
MKTIALYNLKGGVGKTASAVNLAHCAASSGRRTVLLDLDPQGAASFYLKSEAGEKFSAKKFTQGKGILRNLQSSAYRNLDVLPSDFSFRSLDLLLDGEKKPEKILGKILETFRESHDLVFVDCPASIGLDAETVFHAADLILMPVIPTTLSMETLEKVLSFIQEKGYGHKPLAAFFSMVDGRKSMHRSILSEKGADTSRFLRIPIPYASEVERMGVYRAPVTAQHPTSRTSIAYRALWSEIWDRYFA